MIGNEYIDLGRPVSSHDLNSGLQMWWLAINQGPYFGGTRFLDLKGGVHGTLAGTATWEGPIGRNGGKGSVLLNANGDQLNLSLTVTPPYTFAFWMRPTAWNGTNPGIWRVTGANAFNIFQGSTGRPWIRDTAASDILKPAAGYAVPLDEWTRCVFQASTTTSGFSANGVSKHTGSGGTGTAFSVTIIGWQATNDERVTGHFDSFKFWNRYLSDADIAAEYADEVTGYPLTLNRVRPYTMFDVAAAAGNPYYYYQQAG